MDRTKLSKALIDDETKLQWRTPEMLKDEFKVDFKPATVSPGFLTNRIDADTWQSVNKIDKSASTVTTSSGEQIKYDHLVVAPGGKPKKIPIEGADLEGVLTLRSVQDTKKITSSVNKDSEIVIIGTSFIGMEVSMALLKKEPKSVTLVGMDEIPFAAILGEEIGKALMEVRDLKTAHDQAAGADQSEHEEAGNQVHHEGRRRKDCAIR